VVNKVRCQTPKKGDRFGRISLLERSKSDDNGNSRWLCRCDCGNEKVIYLFSLRNKNTRSCGCLLKERTKETHTTHGKSSHVLYRVWESIKQRCNNSKNTNYHTYGGRGIIICPAWESSFEKFLQDVEGDYKEGLELDRIDNNKGYSKENCRWVTHQQNMFNKRGHSYSENGSKYKGVFPNGNNYMAKIKKKYLGTFPSEIEAALAYDKEAVAEYGEYAFLNFKESK